VSRKNKLRKFAEVHSFPNVYECFEVHEGKLLGEGMQPVELAGQWNEKHFKREAPIILELACGAGEYTLGLARMYPDRHFIGIDLKGNRLHAGAKEALVTPLPNAAFLRGRIELIDQYFAKDEVSEIWITFCDPFPRPSKSNRRLTSPVFIEKYRKILPANGLIHLKHDDLDFVNFTLEVIASDDKCSLEHLNMDIYAGELPLPELAIKTLYEGKHLAAGKTIKYLRFKAG
jgi:tRNA (guanine-N7-)-methyltransferase